MNAPARATVDAFNSAVTHYSDGPDGTKAELDSGLKQASIHMHD